MIALFLTLSALAVPSGAVAYKADFGGAAGMLWSLSAALLVLAGVAEVWP